MAADTSLEQLVHYAKLRQSIELDYRQLKEELGLDHFEGWSWIGRKRHVTLTMLAYAFLTKEQLLGLKKGPQIPQS